MSTIIERLEAIAHDVRYSYSHPYAVIETATDVEHDRYPTYEAAAWDCRFDHDLHVEHPGPIGRVIRPIWRRIRGRIA